MKISYRYLALFLGTIICCCFNSMGQDGAAIFQQNCAACHKLGMRVERPDLIGVNEKSNAEWLIVFIKSSSTMIKAGDANVVAIFEEFNNKMMNDQLHLNDDEIRSIMAYLKLESLCIITENLSRFSFNRLQKDGFVFDFHTICKWKHSYMARVTSQREL